ncbi:MAG: hypothetical protein AAF960_13325, partial [Bacteroidota bacterium]
YNGDIAYQSSDWRNFYNHATFNAQITSSRSYSPHKSLYVDHKSGYANSEQMDVVRKIGEYSSGRYLMKWKMYVPHNRNAAFNFQKYKVPGAEAGLVVYMRKGKGIALRANGQIYQSSKTYRQGTWIDVVVDYHLNGRFAAIHIDNKLIAIWDTRLKHNTSAYGVNRLGGVNFWAYHDYTTFYVDDFCIEDNTGISILYAADAQAIDLTGN